LLIFEKFAKRALRKQI
jgi:hypothetical protein